MAGLRVADIRARLKELDEERDHLVALVVLYERREREQGVVTSNGAGNNGATKHVPPHPFVPVRGGPTDRIKAVLAAEEGLTYGQIIERAVVGMTSASDNPERSVGSTLQSLVQRGKVERRDKRHYLVAEEATAPGA
jgi:hypothetical protein